MLSSFWHASVIFCVWHTHRHCMCMKTCNIILPYFILYIHNSNMELRDDIGGATRKVIEQAWTQGQEDKTLPWEWNCLSGFKWEDSEGRAILMVSPAHQPYWTSVTGFWWSVLVKDFPWCPQIEILYLTNHSSL